MKLTCKNATATIIKEALTLNEIFTRNEYKECADNAEIGVPSFNTLLNNEYIFPVSSEIFWRQNEYFELVKCTRYFYSFAK